MLLDSQFDGLGAEEIYRAREQQAAAAQPKPGQGAPAPGQGQGQGQGANGQGQGAPAAGAPANGQGAPTQGQGTPAPANGAPGQGTGDDDMGPGGVFAPDDLTPASTQAEADRWQVLTRQALNVAKAHNAGTLPGYLQEIATSLNRPTVDFRDLLANWVDSNIVTDYSFSRPNRHLIHTGFYLPGVVSDGLAHVVFAVDTSGSLTADMLKAALSEVGGAMESGKFQRLTVLQADMRVCSVAEYGPGDEIDTARHGGGGTDFRATFEWIKANASDASAVVYLTDLEVDRFGEEPDCPVLWATFGDSRRFDRLAAKVPFGEPLYIGRL
ncbi:MAG: VWA-like domain-containing protein [Pseudomonadota bacterium]